MKITNKTTDQNPFKVCVYLKDDPGIVPIETGVFYVNDQPGNNEAIWSPPPSVADRMFHVKIFHPQFLDAFLCETTADKNTAGVVTGSNGRYEIRVKELVS